ncbi:MAG: choice-of-anchor J domain-containing protein [Bacteroidales bacterium]
MKNFYLTGIIGILMMLFIPFQHVSGQGPALEIGDGIHEEGLPIDPYHSYSYSQTIFLQEEIDVDGERIYKLGFYYNGGRHWDDQVRIYMAHTDQETLTGYITEDLTLVYEGTCNVVNQEGWAEISLQVPFEYNNEDNLLIAMTEDQPGFRLNAEFHSTAVDSNMSLLAVKDMSPAYDPANPPQEYQIKNYRPNIRMWFEDIPDGPALSIQPPQLYYFYIHENNVKTINVTLKNTGTDDLVINGLDNNGLPFHTNYSGTIEAGETELVDIRFEPTQPGMYNGYVSLETNSVNDPVYIYVEGFAVSEYAIIETFDNTEFPPEQWTVDPGSWNRRGFGGFMGGGNAMLGATASPGMLITPKVNIQEGDEVVFYASKQTTGELTVRHSYDNENWTDLETIDLTGSYQRYIIDTDGYEGLGYIAFYGEPRVYLDYIIAPDIYHEVAPNPASHPRPADGLEDAFITQLLQWNASALAQGYKVYLGTDNPPTNIIDGQDVGTNRYFKTPQLDYDTEYYWQVVPYNDMGDAVDCPVWSFQTIIHNPVTAFPFEEGFENNEGAVPPADWITQNGYWTTTTDANSGEFAAMASFNHPVDAILITPPLQIPDAAEYELIFYWRNGWIYGKDDKDKRAIGHDTLYVEVSQDYGQSWDVKGIFSAPEPMYNFSPANADLADYSGEEIYIRFRHSTDGDANNALPMRIDDISVAGTITEPVAWINEESWNAESIPNNTWTTSEEFRLRNMGAGVLTVDEASFSGNYFTSTFEEDEVELAFGEEYVFYVSFEPFEDGEYPQTFLIETNGGDIEIELEGNSMPVEPFVFENFQTEAFPPHGWMTHDMNQDYVTWMLGYGHVHTPYSGNHVALSFSFVPGMGELEPDNWLVTPKIEVDDEQEFSFQVANGDPTYAYDHYKVYVSTTTNRLDEFTEVLWEETLQPGDTAWSERALDLTPYTGQDIYIAFHHTETYGEFLIKIDHIEVRDIVEDIDVEAPYADPEPGEVPAGTEVTLMTDTENADIFYTLDGEDPDDQSELFTNPIVIENDVTIKAIAHKDGFFSDISAFEYTVSTTAIEESELIDITVYPNPASDVLRINKATGQVAEVRVMDVMGNEVLRQQMKGASLELEVLHLHSGVYILRIEEDGKPVIVKFTIK